MKIIQIKLPAIVLAFSFIAILCLSDCGQNDSTKKGEVVTDSVKKAVNNPIVTVDSPATVLVDPVTIEKPVNTQPVVITDPKKEIVPANNTKVPDPAKKPTVVQPVVTNNKPAPNTNVPPVTEKPVVKPVEPPVVTVPEPEKPKPVNKPVEVTKPPVVVNPTPAPVDWNVPAKYKTMTSPYSTDKEAFDLGKSVYGTHCKSCHGTKGDGKGPKAAQLDTEMRSFLTSEFRTQKPGEVYYKTVFGRKDMPKFENKIADDEERWAVVYYILNMK